MPTFRYRKQVVVGDDEEVILEIKLPDAGSTSYHFIDVPGPIDRERTGEVDEIIGTGSELKAERTVIHSSPINVNPNMDDIRQEIYINGVQIVDHINLKNVDQTPLVITTIVFI
ncbi:MAG: hypothetical protein JNL40_09750 [Cyclobacteriaceae bacterium]|nr:hypothetical protein [Cyclobacteriaceae bacterium]